MTVGKTADQNSLNSRRLPLRHKQKPRSAVANPKTESQFCQLNTGKRPTMRTHTLLALRREPAGMSHRDRLQLTHAEDVRGGTSGGR